MYQRIFVIVLDSLGVGAMPDSKEYGDIGVDTFGHIGEKMGTMQIPNLQKLGMANLHSIPGVEPVKQPLGVYTKLRERSLGKDTMTGHWEMMGLYITKPFITFTENGFPDELIKELEKETGRKVIGNKSASGTVILDELGEEEIQKGHLIVYTSADSVMQSQQSGSYEEQGSDISQELDSKLQEGESELPSENNPLENISNIKKSNLLQIVVSNPEQLSQKQISLGGLPSHRNLQKGIGRFPTKSDAQGKISSLFFCQYLLEHFGNAVDQKKENTLSYEMEYILEGKESDQQNLEAVVKKLLLMRSGANYLYLLTDAGKQAEAETLAVSLSTAIALPVLTGLVKQAILVAWAFGEAVMDIRALLDGKRVALIKTHDTWQLQLSGLLKLGTAEDQKEGMDAEGVLRYKEYLMFLFFLKSEQVCTMRALDLIEMEMKKKPGEETFQVDHCVTKLQVKSKCKIRRGVNYQFSTYFGYE